MMRTVKTKYPNLLARMLKDFFTYYLSELRGMSPHTIQSYRDCLILLLRYLSAQKKCPVVKLELNDFTSSNIKSFLDYLQNERNCTVSTRNIRLSAVHTFFKFVSTQNPDHLELCQSIMAIPFKKTTSRIIDYLDYNEMEKILSVINRSTETGRRDYALMATMFNTGARVQEIVNIRACDLQLIKPYQVLLRGKGKKQRYCPLWTQTARLLKNLCIEQQMDYISNKQLFQNSRGDALTRFGVGYILKKHVMQAKKIMPTLRSKHIHPHSIRHSTAIALLKSGVDLVTVSHWLGHSCITTTNRYASIDLDMKRKAIEKAKSLPNSESCPFGWKNDNTILAWLESL